MIITKELDHLLSTQKRKDARARTKKVYNALLYKRGKNTGFFQVPSAYLEKISSRYYKAIELLLEHNIIAFQSFNYDETDLFNTRRKKYYNTEKGVCARYRFLIDTDQGYEEDFTIDYTGLYDNEKWYNRTRLSLLELGFDPEGLNIKRDNFSRRLHTNITGNIGNGSYKDLLSGGDYWSIDAKTCQPRLLWLYLQEIGLQDKNLNWIFENDQDFYQYIIDRIPALKDRDDAKETFVSWINGTGYLDAEKAVIRDIFGTANEFIKNFKKKDYKNICRLLQYKEASIFIDKILNDIPLDFCLTVHDSIIIRKEDKDMALDYCATNHPELIFEAKEIKR